MKIIEINSKNYPEKLRKIYNPPKRLYIMGDETILNNFAIGIVGSRKCSEYGKHVTKSMAYNLSKYNVNIISGMAKGIDKEAHIGCMLAKRENNCCASEADLTISIQKKTKNFLTK